MNADIPSNAPSSATMFASEQAPTFASEQAPTFASEQAPTFASEQAPTSVSEQAPTHHSEPPTDAGLSESEYLARESALTKAALVRTFEDLKKSLRTSADLRLWTRRHPWAALGVAAVAGFSAATVVAAKRTPKADASADRNGHEQDSGRDNSSRQLAATIFSSLFDLAKVALETSIAAAAQSQPADRDAYQQSVAPSNAESSDG